MSHQFGNTGGRPGTLSGFIPQPVTEGNISMGFLKRFLKNNWRDGQEQRGTSSFHELSEEQLETHLGVARYGNFKLTDAVRPSYDLQVVPQSGYRHDSYQDQETGVDIPVLMASVTSEHLLDLFFDLMNDVGGEVDVVLETSHENTAGGHADLYREHIDLPVLKSILYDFEDLLLNDGCTGIAILNPKLPVEVQLDEHKLLVMYGRQLNEFEGMLAEYGLQCFDEMKFITEAEHVHSSSDEFGDRFSQLKYRLGIDE
jgi:hypothetical protein